jgi:hypothetical protein
MQSSVDVPVSPSSCMEAAAYMGGCEGCSDSEDEELKRQQRQKRRLGRKT